MRRDLRPIRPGDEAAIELKLLTSRRADLVEDRTRAVNRLRGTLLSMFPALDMTNSGPLRLLTGYQTPAAIRRAGVTRLTKWLANRKVRSAGSLAEVMALNEQIAKMDRLIEGRFREHELADIVRSVPGIGTTLAAEFLAAVGGSLDEFHSPDALAACAGVAQHHATRAKSAAISTGRSATTQAPARLLHLRADQRPLRPELAEVLRPQTRRREETRPDRARPRAPTRQRHLGPHS